MKLDRQEMGFKPQSVDKDEKKKVVKSVNEAEDLMLTIAEEHHTYVSIPWIDDIMRTLRVVAGEKATAELAKFVADELERNQVFNPGHAAGNQAALGAGNQADTTAQIAELQRKLDEAERQNQRFVNAFGQVIEASGVALKPGLELVDHVDEVAKRVRTLRQNANVVDVTPDTKNFVPRADHNETVRELEGVKAKLDNLDKTHVEIAKLAPHVKAIDEASDGWDFTVRRNPINEADSRKFNGALKVLLGFIDPNKNK